ncbi:T9SS type A sorting domain-containing protein [Flexithrix dorotheae]|uniref:T9SS type A sorting domain-containing protein n=1 Tax=Flexithrix dorotheae TaxID=70993 RepID=UPI00035D882B|nr:T9SS type A sorting domain-containing protein [Flexithrix dorotheae]
MRNPANFNSFSAIIQPVFNLKSLHYFLAISWLIFLLHGEIQGHEKASFNDPENPPKLEITLPKDSMIVYGDYVEILYSITGDSADYSRIKLTLDHKNSVNTNAITGKFTRSRLDSGYHHAKLELLDSESNPLANPESRMEISFFLEEKIPAPSNVAANLIDPYNSKITWEKVPGLIGNYLIEVSDSIDGVYTVLDSVPMEENSYVHHVPNPETILFYRIKAVYHELVSESSASDFIKTNGLPQMGNISKTIEEDSLLVFYKNDFVEHFSDPNLDSLGTIKILSTVPDGELLLDGNTIENFAEITSDKLEKLSFQPVENWFGELSIPMSFSDGIHFSKDTAWINISVIPVNDAPKQLSLDNFEIEENNEPGKVIGRFSAYDVENEKLEFSLAKSGDFAHFKIENDFLIAVDSFDYELQNQFFLTANVRDQSGGELAKSFEINVIDLSEKETNNPNPQEPQIPTGIDDFKELSGVSVYPNPVHDRLNIEINNDLRGDFQIIILDITGKVIYQNELEKNQINTSTSFDFSAMNPGLYIVKISGMNYGHTHQTIKH